MGERARGRWGGCQWGSKQAAAKFAEEDGGGCGDVEALAGGGVGGVVGDVEAVGDERGEALRYAVALIAHEEDGGLGECGGVDAIAVEVGAEDGESGGG